MKYTILIGLSLLLLGNCFAQTSINVDSIEKAIAKLPDTSQVLAYHELYKQYFQQDLKTVRIFADRALEIAEGTEDLALMANSENVLGIHFLQISEFDSAVMYFQYAEEKFEQLGNDLKVLSIINNLAVVFEDKGNYEKALELHLKALKKKELLDVAGDNLATTYWNLGNVSMNLKQYEQSMDWFQQAYKIYQDLGELEYQIDLKHQFAMIHSQTDSLELSNKIFLECAQYYDEHGMNNALAGTYDNLGDNYIDLKEYELAESYLTKALSLSLKHGVQSLPGQIYRRLSKLYLDQNKLMEAEKYAKLSLENAQNLGRNKKEIEDHHVLSMVYEKQGKFQKALSEFKLYHIQNDSIFGMERMNAMHAMQIDYERARKEQEIKLLEEKSKREKFEKQMILLGLFLSLFLFVSIIYALSQRAKRNRLAREKSEQALVFSKRELDIKKQELVAYALQLASKNEFLVQIKEDVAELKPVMTKTNDLRKIIKTIDRNHSEEDSWDEFKSRFLSLHKNFDKKIKLKFSSITANDLRLISLIRMNLTNKQMASILNISSEGIKKARYRIRKKLELTTGDSLEDFIMGF